MVLSNLEKVAALSLLPIHDDVPTIESAPSSVTLQLGSKPDVHPLGYVDVAGLLAEHPFREDFGVIAKMEALLVEGQAFVSLLYTFRSSAKALPVVSKDNMDAKAEIYRRTFQVLRPEVQKLVRVQEYVDRAVGRFASTVQLLVQPERRKRVVPEAMYDSMVRLVDLLIKLDNLKDMKACMQNDFALYKRAFHNVRSALEEGDRIADEVHNLQMFLADPRCPKSTILHRLRTAVRGFHGHEHVLVDLFEHCVGALGSKRYLLPDEKWRLVRFLPHLMFLLDGDSDEKSAFNVFKSKYLSAGAQAAKIFRHTPVVPVFGDMHIQLAYILQRCPHYDAAQHATTWGVEHDSAKVARSYALSTHWKAMRAAYDGYVARFTTLVALVRSTAQRCDGDKGGDGHGDAVVGPDGASPSIPSEVAERVAQTCLEGLRLLCEWKERVLAQARENAQRTEHSASAADLWQRIVLSSRSSCDLGEARDRLTELRPSLPTSLRRRPSSTRAP